MKRVSRECASEQRSVLARLASLAHIGELARRLPDSSSCRHEKLFGKVWTPIRYVDCEQSLFFFRFSESSARARERRSREKCETRRADREEKKKESLFFVPLPSRAFSHARGHLRVSRFGRWITEKRDTARSLSDYMWLSILEIGARQLRSVTEISPK